MVYNNLLKTEQAYSMIDSAVALITSELGLVAQKMKNVNFI